MSDDKLALRKIVAITSRSPGMTERELGLSMGRIQEICEAALAAHASEQAQAAEPVGWQVWWGLGQMRPHWPPFKTKNDAETHASMIRSNTEVRPIYASPQAKAAEAEKQAGPVATDWRRLALQFDGQRMAAMVHLRTLLAFPDTHAEAARSFLAATPSEQIASVTPSESDKEDAAPEQHEHEQAAFKAWRDMQPYGGATEREKRAFIAGHRAAREEQP